MDKLTRSEIHAAMTDANQLEYELNHDAELAGIGNDFWSDIYNDENFVDDDIFDGVF